MSLRYVERAHDVTDLLEKFFVVRSLDFHFVVLELHLTHVRLRKVKMVIMNDIPPSDIAQSSVPRYIAEVLLLRTTEKEYNDGGCSFKA